MSALKISGLYGPEDSGRFCLLEGKRLPEESPYLWST